MGVLVIPWEHFVGALSEPLVAFQHRFITVLSSNRLNPILDPVVAYHKRTPFSASL